MFHQGLKGRLWKVKADSYHNTSTCIKWQGDVSNPFKVLQGTKQGGLASADDYKSYLLDLLNLLDKSNVGVQIGSISIGHPTVADDMVLLADSLVNAQIMLSLATFYANREHYTIHPEKSLVMPINFTSKAELEHFMSTKPLRINNGPASTSLELTHLGIQRNSKASATSTYEARLTSARRSLYSLTGAGLHGFNGLPADTCLHLYKVFVIPRATYGIEAITYTAQNVKLLEVFHRSSLRNILGLPQRTAISALHILTGVPPMEAILDIKIIMFLHTLLSKPGPTRDVIIRQYAMKGWNSHSWVVQAKRILQKYSLPTIPDLAFSDTSRTEWKKLTKQAVHSRTSEIITEEAKEKSTLRFLTPTFTYGTPHISITHTKNPREVSRSNIKLRLLTGTYKLQTMAHKYKQSPSPTCPLCTLSNEDTQHFILQCRVLNPVREKYICGIKEEIPRVYTYREHIISSPKLFTQLILDSSHEDVCHLLAKTTRKHRKRN